MAKKKKKKGSKKRQPQGKGVARTATKAKQGNLAWKRKEKLKLADEISALEKRIKIKGFEVDKAKDVLKTKNTDFANLIADLREKAATIDALENGNYQMNLDLQQSKSKGNGKPDSRKKGPTAAEVKEGVERLKEIVKKYSNDLDTADIYDPMIAHINKRGKTNNPITKGSLALAVLGSRKHHDIDRAQTWLDKLCEKGLVLRDITDSKLYFWVKPDKNSGGGK